MHPKATPKDFFLWAGAMISLFASVFAFITLIFSYIDYVFPDALNYYASNPYQSGMSYQIASLIVLVPLFLILMRVIRKNIQKDATRAEVWVRRWALYLTIFIAGATIAIDLIVLLNTFLRGDEITVRFLLKAAVVLLVAGGGFMHFLADLWGHWLQYPSRARAVGFGVAILVLVSIVAGFFIIGTPWQARLYRLDEQKTADLQGIQSQIVYYWQQKQKLPRVLTDLNDPLSYYTVPVDSQTGAPYEYASTGATSFKLCATFNAEDQNAITKGMREVVPAAPTSAAMPVDYSAPDNWKHGMGRQCFERTIDPERYPPIKK